VGFPLRSDLYGWEFAFITGLKSLLVCSDLCGSRVCVCNQFGEFVGLPAVEELYAWQRWSNPHVTLCRFSPGFFWLIDSSLIDCGKKIVRYQNEKILKQHSTLIPRICCMKKTEAGHMINQQHKQCSLELFNHIYQKQICTILQADAHMAVFINCKYYLRVTIVIYTSAKQNNDLLNKIFSC
jgi:hypothetical protein